MNDLNKAMEDLDYRLGTKRNMNKESSETGFFESTMR